MGLGGVAIAVPPYVIHPKTAVLGRAGGVILINNQAVTILFTTFSLYRFTILSNKVLELFPPNKRSFTFCRILEILDAEEFSKIVISLFTSVRDKK